MAGGAVLDIKHVLSSDRICGWCGCYIVAIAFVYRICLIRMAALAPFPGIILDRVIHLRVDMAHRAVHIPVHTGIEHRLVHIRIRVLQSDVAAFALFGPVQRWDRKIQIMHPAYIMAFWNDAARRLCRMCDVCGVVRRTWIFEYADELVCRVPVAPCAV